MQKSLPNKIAAGIMAVAMVLSEIPTSVFAEGITEANLRAEKGQSENTARVLPEDTAPLSDILEKDDDGFCKMYTTLYDSKDRIIDTNDPEYSTDKHYKDADDGGDGATVDLDAVIDVRFRMAGIIPNDEGGVEENVTYLGDILPSALVPESEHDGATLINPDEPFAFVKIIGDIEVYGGLYGDDDDGFRFKMFFDNVEDQIDISGAYQYSSTINTNEVHSGDSVTLNFGSAGEVGFKVTPEQTEPKIEYDDYEIEIKGGKADTSTPTYYWEAEISKTEHADVNSFPYRTLTLTNDSGTAYVINEAGQTIFSAYGRAGDNNQLWLGLTYEDGSTKKITASESDILNTDHGTTKIRFKDSRKSFVADLEFSANSALSLSLDEDEDGNLSYMTQKAVLSVGDGAGGNAPDIKKITIHIPTTYYAYRSASSMSQNGKAVAEGNEAETLSKTGSFSITSYTPGINTDTSNNLEHDKWTAGVYLDNDTVEAEIYCPAGYTQITYNPDYDDEANKIVRTYVSNKSFISKDENNDDEAPILADSDIEQHSVPATFMKFVYNDGSCEITDWEYVGAVNNESIKNGHLSNIYGSDEDEKILFSDSIGDAEFQYKLKSIASDISQSNGQFVVYRSSEKVSNGKYIYVMIDPETNFNAAANHHNGQDILTENGSQRPGSFKLHVFNAEINGKITIKVPQSVGAVNNIWEESAAGSKESSCPVTQVSAETVYGEKQETACLEYTQNPAGILEGKWVDANTIFWTMTLDLNDIADKTRGMRLYVTGKGLSFSNSNGVTVDGQSLGTPCLYVDTSSNVNTTSWSQLSGWGKNWVVAENGINDAGYGTTLTMLEDCATYTYGSLSQYAKNGIVKLGFFSETANIPEDGKFVCKAQLVLETGDISDLSDENSGISTYPIRISALGEIGNVNISKTGTSISSGKSGEKYGGLRNEWTLSFAPAVSLVMGQTGTKNLNGSTLADYGMFGGYNGRLTVADTMRGSSATNQDKEKVSTDPANYTYITNPLVHDVTICEVASSSTNHTIHQMLDIDGQNSEDGEYYEGWYKYDNESEEWVGITEENYSEYGWNPKEAGVYKYTVSTESPNTTQDPLEVYIYYSGNMYDPVYSDSAALSSYLSQHGELNGKSSTVFSENSFIISVNGIGHAPYESLTATTWKYETELDPSAYIAAVQEKDGGDITTMFEDVTLKNSAKLASTYNLASPSKSQTSGRVAMYLAIEKDIVKDKVAVTPSNEAEYEINVTTGLKGAQAPSVEIEDYIESFTNVDEDGNRLPGEDDYKVDENEDVIKSLVTHLKAEEMWITKKDKDGKTQTIYTWKNGFISGWSDSSAIEYHPSNNTEKDNLSEISLFKITLKPDEGTIENGTTFSVSYTMRLDTDITKDKDGKTFRESDYYAGKYVAIGNGATASRELTSQQKLSVDSKAIVSGALLNNGLAVKELKSSNNDGSGTWAAHVYTGSIGKGKNEEKTYLEDTVTWAANGFTYTADDGTEVNASDSGIKALVEHVIEKNTTYKNVRLYLKDGDGEVETPDENLIYEFGEDALFTINGNGISGTKATKDDLGELTVTSAPSGKTSAGSITLEGRDGKDRPISFTLTTRPSELVKSEKDGVITYTHNHGGATLETTGLEYNKLLSMVYDMSVDWQAVEDDLRDIFGSYKITCKITNSVADDRKHWASHTGNYVKISAASITKSVNADSASGSAVWTVNADTGSTECSEFKIKDGMTFGIGIGVNESVRTAAEKATSIDPQSIEISLDGKKIYIGGMPQNGWTNDNISVDINGLSFEITLKDTENNKVLARNQNYTVTYKTVLNKETYIANGGTANAEYSITNTALLKAGEDEFSVETQVPFKPNVAIKTTKKFEKKNGNIATWTVTANTGEVSRRSFVLTDKTADGNDAVKSALSIESVNITVTTGKEGEDGYSMNTYSTKSLPDGVSIKTTSGEDFALGKTGSADFVITFDSLPKETEVSITYTTRLDKKVYIANGGGDETDIELNNVFAAESADGASSSSTVKGSVSLGKTFQKIGEVTTAANNANGIPVITWTFKANLTQEYTQDELKEMSEVTLVDNLSPVLSFVEGSVTVTDEDGTEIPFNLETTGRLLSLAINNPADYPNIVWTFKTTCAASIDTLVNEGTIKINGITKETIASDDLGSVKAEGQNGIIKASKRPSYTPTAVKYVDSKICTTADMYNFTITAVDENGIVLTGADAYTETVKNKGDGSITFSEIKYKAPKESGETKSYYYEIKETGPSIEDESEYKVLDNTVFTVRVDVMKTVNGYLVTDEVVSPENHDSVSFNNTTKAKTTSFTVTKKWSDQNNKYETRPAQVIVKLYKNGESYNNTSITLNDSNNWTYTWNNLPVAGGEYSAVEEDVEGYEASIEKTNTGAVITNTLKTDDFSVSKVWKDNDNKNGLRPESINIHLYNDGKEVVGSSVKLSEENKWAYTWSGLPTGGTYTVQEESVPGYKTSIEAKGNASVITNTLETTSHTVKKVWSNSDNKSGKRPESITVHLYKNGQLVEDEKDVVLNEKNDWTYTWSGLLGSGYTAVEDTVPGYTVSSVTEGNTTTITNTLVEEKKQESASESPGGSTNESPKESSPASSSGGSGAIAVYKVDKDDNTKYLGGAIFSLYKSDGTKVGTYTTNDKGYFGVSFLTYGSYYLIEDNAPAGYVGNSDRINFVLNEQTSYSNAYPWNIKAENSRAVEEAAAKGTPADVKPQAQQVQETQEQTIIQKIVSRATGDSSNIILYTTGIIIGAGAVVLIMKRKKKS